MHQHSSTITSAGHFVISLHIVPGNKKALDIWPARLEKQLLREVNEVSGHQNQASIVWSERACWRKYTLHLQVKPTVFVWRLLAYSSALGLSSMDSLGPNCSNCSVCTQDQLLSWGKRCITSYLRYHIKLVKLYNFFRSNNISYRPLGQTNTFKLDSCTKSNIQTNIFCTWSRNINPCFGEECTWSQHEYYVENTMDWIINQMPQCLRRAQIITQPSSRIWPSWATTFNVL